MRAAEIREAFAALVRERRITRAVQVGAHDGEEVPHLLGAGVTHLTLVEPIPRLAAKLRARWPRVEVVQAACSDHAGMATLYVPARTNMATLVGPDTAADGEALVVPTVRLDDIAPDAEAAVIDVQGHEMQVLAAAPWDSLRLLMVETLHGVEDAALSPPYEQVATFMAGKGFEEVARYVRDYDWIQRWAYGRATTTGAEVRDVVYART